MKKHITILFSSLSMLFLNACSNLSILTANAPTVFFDGKVKKNIDYGHKSLQKLDIYIPSLKPNEKSPVIVFFYGGRWTDGKKEDCAFVATTLASKGFIVAIPDHRKYPDIRVPTFVEDGAKAVNWVHENIADYGGDPETIFMAGHSSGAHIASLLVSDAHYLNKHGHALKAIKGFAGLAGPYAFEPQDADLKDMFGPPANYPKMQTPTFIDGNEPSMLLMVGGKDQLVARFNAERLASKINEKTGRVEIRTYPELDHVEMVGVFSWILRSKAPVAHDMAAFFKSLM